MEKPIFYNNIKTNYTVDDQGNVYSLNYNKTHKKHIMKPTKDKDGYNTVNIVVNKKRIHCRNARLVAEAFIENDDPENKIQVNHKNGKDKINDSVENLEWVTCSENIIHAIDTGLINIKRGEESSNSKYNVKLIRKICNEIEKNQLSLKEISKKFNVKKSLVESIFYRRTWRNISYDYDFSNYDKNKKNSESSIRKICSEIEKNQLSLKEISKKFNVKLNIVRSVYYKQTWSYISDDYDFSKYNKKKS